MQSVYKIRHKPTGRYYRGSTYCYLRTVNPEAFFKKVFTVNGKIYNKLAFCYSGLSNICDSRPRPWKDEDIEIVEFSLEELGVVSG